MVIFHFLDALHQCPLPKSIMVFFWDITRSSLDWTNRDVLLMWKSKTSLEVSLARLFLFLPWGGQRVGMWPWNSFFSRGSTRQDGNKILDTRIFYYYLFLVGPKSGWPQVSLRLFSNCWTPLCKSGDICCKAKQEEAIEESLPEGVHIWRLVKIHNYLALPCIGPLSILASQGQNTTSGL